jgi:ligand-binding SRPBCC domain-containing protein
VTVTFEVCTEIVAPIEDVFDLARDIGVHVASQAGARERAVDGVTSGPIGLDQTVTFRARHFGIWFSLTSRIVAFEPPHRFVDQQIQGPFDSIEHEHLFVESDHAVTMIDRVAFTAPVGPIGRVVERLILDHHLRNLITRRGAFLKAEAERPGRS